MKAARFRVTGRVQGVWYRDSTRREAERLGIDGSAVNQADGSVEVIARGEEAALEALEAWLRQGPPLAEVAGVVRESLEPDAVPAGFRTG